MIIILTFVIKFMSLLSLANIKFGDEGVFLFDPHTLGVLTEEQGEASLLAGFCEKGTVYIVDSNSFLIH